MRELGDHDAPDEGDNRADAVPENAGDACPPRYEVVRDEASRKAAALGYRAKVEATNAAYDAREPKPPEGEADHIPANHAVDGTAGQNNVGNRHPRRSDDAEQPQSAARNEHADQDGGPADSRRAGDAEPDKVEVPGEATTGAESGGQPGGPVADRSLGGAAEGRRDDGPGDVAGRRPDTGSPAHADRGAQRQPPPTQDAPEAAQSGKPQDSWPPSKADQDRVRKLYSEYLADMTSADRQNGRNQGTNVVGATPDRSPGEISGLPPAGDKLTEMESHRKSRLSDLLQESEKQENFGDLHDAVEEDTSTVQRLMAARPPEGHAEQPVPAHHPYITPWVPEHGIDGGSAATTVLVAGILTAHMVRWIDDKLKHGKGDHDDRNG